MCYYRCRRRCAVEPQHGEGIFGRLSQSDMQQLIKLVLFQKLFLLMLLLDTITYSCCLLRRDVRSQRCMALQAAR